MNFTYLGIIFITFFVLQALFKLLLDYLNYRHRQRHIDYIPEELVGFVDGDKLKKINLYSNDKLVLSLVDFFVENIVILSIIFLGLIPKYYNFILTITTNQYLVGFSLFISYFLIQFIIEIPFRLYQNFNIEKKYGFNKMTLKVWFLDKIKVLIISFIINALLLFPLMFFIFTFKDIWFLFVWGFVLLFSLFIQRIYPNVIAPLFNKFEPLKNLELKSKIETLLTQCGFKSNGLFEMDASKRTSHGNAYFTGIGKSKRIVFFDTLLKNHTDNEILSILSHELGHFKHKHILKGMIFSAIISLIGLTLVSLVIDSNIIYETFKFGDKFRVVGLFLYGYYLNPYHYFCLPYLHIFLVKMNFRQIGLPKIKWEVQSGLLTP